MAANIREQYTKAADQMLKAFGYSSSMAVPKIEKVVVNTSFAKLISGKTGDDYRKTIEEMLANMTAITGQKPAPAQSKKSIAGFKLRKGVPVGAKVTLRGKRMEQFLDRLIGIVLPRTRDFQGLNPTCVDQSGNCTIGIKEHLSFPEISPEQSRIPMGLEITVVTTAQNKKEGLALLQFLGFPFKQEG